MRKKYDRLSALSLLDSVQKNLKMLEQTAFQIEIRIRDAPFIGSSPHSHDQMVGNIFGGDVRA